MKKKIVSSEQILGVFWGDCVQIYRALHVEFHNCDRRLLRPGSANKIARIAVGLRQDSILLCACNGEPVGKQVPLQVYLN